MGARLLVAPLPANKLFNRLEMMTVMVGIIVMTDMTAMTPMTAMTAMTVMKARLSIGDDDGTVIT